MNDAELREMMRLLERPAAVPPELTERVFRLMVAELEAGAPDVPARAPVRGRGARLPWSPWWRTSVAVAAVALLVVGAVTVLTVARAPSALAALQDARTRFEQLPAYHARTSVRANDDARDPDLEARWETEDWRQDSRHWRTTVLSSSSTAYGAPGDFRVASPELYATFDAVANLFTARPSDALDPTVDPSFWFDPSLQWWSTGVEGDAGRPTDVFIEENCSATPATLLDRAATKLVCDVEPQEIELWLDDETGLLLRVSTFEVVREITSLEVDPEVPAELFDVTPPEGARRRWDGSTEPPPEYRVEPDAEVDARYDVTGARVDGLSIAQITGSDVWVLATRCTDRCDTELARVDIVSGRVVATVASPAGTAFDDLELVGDELWAAYSQRVEETPTPSSFVQRLDTASNRLVDEAIEIGTPSGGLAASDATLWSTSGRSRSVTVGRVEAEYHALARIDVGRSEVVHFDLEADAIGRPLVLGESLWVPTTMISPRDPFEMDYELVQVDLRTGRVGHRVSVPGWPSSLTTDGRRVLALFADDSQQWRVGAIDAASGQLSLVDVGPPGSEFGGMAVAAGHLWIASATDQAVLRLDLSTMQVAGRITTGPVPVDVDTGEGSVWVTNAGDGTLTRIDVD